MGAGEPPANVKPKWFQDLLFTFIAFAIISCAVPAGVGREVVFWYANAFVLKWYFLCTRRGSEDAGVGLICQGAFLFFVLPGNMVVFSLFTFACALLVARRVFPSYTAFFCAFFTQLAQE